VPDQLARFVGAAFTSLGTDGYGISDTRESLRRHFGVDAQGIAAAALRVLPGVDALTPRPRQQVQDQQVAVATYRSPQTTHQAEEMVAP
jgi:pyruvate dehydrogenase E1 component